MRNKIGVLLLALFVLVGCNETDAYDKSVNAFAAQHPKELAFSKDFFAKLQVRDFSWIQSRIDPSIDTPQMPQILSQMADQFPLQNPINVQLMGFTSHEFNMNGDKSTQTNVTFLYEFSGKFLIAQVFFKDSSDDFSILGTHVDLMNESPADINKFTFKGKGILHFAILLWAVAVPIFIIATLIVCLLTPMLKRKWLWMLFIPFGFVQIILDWTSGTIHINPLQFQLLGSGYAQMSPYSPLLIFASFPLGAVIFMLRRKKWLATKPADQTKL